MICLYHPQAVEFLFKEEAEAGSEIFLSESLIRARIMDK